MYKHHLDIEGYNFNIIIGGEKCVAMLYLELPHIFLLLFEFSQYFFFELRG